MQNKMQEMRGFGKIGILRSLCQDNVKKKAADFIGGLFCGLGGNTRFRGAAINRAFKSASLLPPKMSSNSPFALSIV